MSHLPKVEFAADAPEALECITAVTRCVIAGDIVDCAREDMANTWMVVNRVIHAGIERFGGGEDDSPVVISASPEDMAWVHLCDACKIQTEAPKGSTGAAEARAIPWHILLPVLLELLEKILKDRK